MPVFSKVEDFREDFRGFGRCIAIDYGTRKIGIAVGDFENKIAFPDNVLFGNWRKFIDVVRAVLTEILKQNTDIVVIGLPKKLDGSEDEKCLFVRKLADELVRQNDNLKIFLIDERFSTKATQSWVRFEYGTMKKKFNEKVGCKKDKKPDDASAASILLDTFFGMATNYFNTNIVRLK